MARLNFLTILAFFATAAFASSCGGGGRNSANAVRPVTNQERDGAAKTNVEELGIILRIPYESEDIVWKQDGAAKRIIAVLRFSSADAGKVVAEAAAIRPPKRVTLSSESWFPAELIAQGEMSGDGTLSGDAYAANAFLQPPYNDGTITRIENTDYFVLETVAR